MLSWYWGLQLYCNTCERARRDTHAYVRPASRARRPATLPATDHMSARSKSSTTPTTSNIRVRTKSAGTLVRTTSLPRKRVLGHLIHDRSSSQEATALNPKPPRASRGASRRRSQDSRAPAARPSTPEPLSDDTPSWLLAAEAELLSPGIECAGDPREAAADLPQEPPPKAKAAVPPSPLPSSVSAMRPVAPPSLAEAAPSPLCSPPGSAPPPTTPSPAPAHRLEFVDELQVDTSPLAPTPPPPPESSSMAAIDTMEGPRPDDKTPSQESALAAPERGGSISESIACLVPMYGADSIVRYALVPAGARNSVSANVKVSDSASPARANLRSLMNGAAASWRYRDWHALYAGLPADLRAAVDYVAPFPPKRWQLGGTLLCSVIAPNHHPAVVVEERVEALKHWANALLNFHEVRRRPEVKAFFEGVLPLAVE